MEAASPPAQAPADSPFCGLNYFTEDAAELFFGRDSERTVIIGNLRAARLTILYAPSGVGKSSLLHAGVAARVRDMAVRSLAGGESPQFIPLVFSSWRDEPVEELIDALQATVDSLLPDLGLRLGRSSLAEALAAAAAATQATLLVILDQFEEYFLYGATEGTPNRFADELATAVNRRELPANFLIAVREDAYAGIGDLLRGKVMNPYANNFNLDYLDREAAREAIIKPIERYNARHPAQEPVVIEARLTETVLDQVRAGRVTFDHEGQGALTGSNSRAARDRIETPYLQLVLTALWARERAAGSCVLRQATLHELGGAQAIVQSHLERAMARLEEAEREAAAQVFNQLVTPSGAKIVHTVADLAQYSGGEIAPVMALVEKLSSGDQRILRPVPPAPGATEPRVEIFHDVLAPAILAWRSAQASARLERERKAAEERANRERRRARTFRALTAIASALLLVAIVAVILARVETSRAHRAEHLALSRQLSTQAVSDVRAGALSRGVLLGIEAYRLAETADARFGLVRALEATDQMAAYLGGHGADVTSVAYSPDGRMVASGGADATILLQDVLSGRTVRVLRAHEGPVSSIALSPDGKLLASGEGRSVELWDVASGRVLRIVRSAGAVYGLAFSRVGARLAVGGASGAVVLFNPSSGVRLRQLKAGSAVASVAFSPDGRVLASGQADHTVIIWNALTGRRDRVLRGHAAAINDIAFAPGGGTLASASDDRSTIVWSLRSGRALLRLRGDGGRVNAVAFSPGGEVLASAGSARDVMLWDARTGRRLQTLTGHAASVESVAFSPSGETLASGADDDQVILWNVRPRLQQRALQAGGPVVAVAYDPRPPRLAAAGPNGRITLWNSVTGQRVASLDSHTATVETVAFSPDGATLAAGASDHTVRLWNALSGDLEAVLRGHGDSVYSVAFSRDGRTLASGSADGTAILWNARTHARERTLRGHTDFIFDVAFSPDSRMLASASADKSVILWDVTTGRRLHTLIGHTAAVQSVAFSPDGRTLASAGNDGTLMVWDPRGGRRLADPLRGASGGVLSVGFGPHPEIVAAAGSAQSVTLWDLRSRLGEAFPGHTASILGVAISPDGRTMASASLDGTVQMLGPLPLAVSPAAATERLCGVVRRNLTSAEWSEFLPGQPYHMTCPAYR